MALLQIIDEWDTDLASADPLGFPGYAEKLATLDGESVRTGRAEHAVVIEGDFTVLGGSMGVVHGEKVVRAIDRAIELGLPVLVEASSGGARMQEGMVSLIQMARTTAAMGRLRSAGLGSIAVLHHPSTGGVFASYASLCDVVAADAGATIGFAGPRVAEAVTGESVEGRSHTAETAFAAGLVDFVGSPDEVVRWAKSALGLLETPLVVRPRPEPAGKAGTDPSAGTDLAGASAWAEVGAARAAGRPSGLDVAAALVDSWTDLAAPDPTVRSGLATVDGRRVVVIAQDRHTGNGRPTPAGYAQAERAIALAGRRGLPIVTMIDTPGAEPGSAAEQAGIAGAIARVFLALIEAPVPTLGFVVGEGGSGGALALGATDRLLIFEHAVFSVIGAEGAATILYRDASRASEVAELLRLTSADLLDLGIVDAVVPDDVEGAVAVATATLGQVQIGARTSRFDGVARRWVTRRS
ncbi:MAG TPA: carboxyl transferase domain-containing protein [Acidimicrobiales bacterium]|nr:carboxyl transferase domain-containing protein [Acidimicrobiales bacterium]